MEMKRRIIALIIGSTLAALISGCASSNYETVPNASASSAQSLAMGTIVATRHVQIDGTSTNLGLYGGGIMGGAVGRTVGSGDGTILASAGGAVAGAIVGKKVEKALTKKLAQEMTIELDDGRTIVVVQEVRDPQFNSGDRVSVLEGRSGYARVRHEDYTASAY